MELSLTDAMNCGLQSLEQGDLKDAERFFRLILNEHPLHAEVNYHLGLLFVKKRMFSASLQCFRIALQRSPSRVHFWHDYIGALISAELLGEAADACSRAVAYGMSEDSEDAFTKLLKSDEVGANQRPSLQNKISAKRGRQSDRISKKKKSSVAEGPTDAEMTGLLRLYTASRFVEAENIAYFLTKRFPSHPFAWKLIGVIYQRLGRLTEAIECMTMSVSLAPSDWEARSNLGNALKDAGSFKDAEMQLNRAIALNQDYPQAFNNLGSLLIELERYEDAKVHFWRALDLFPSFTEAQYNLGLIFQKLNSLEDAQKSFLAAIKIDPSYAPAHNNLGVIYGELGLLNEARVSITNAIKINPRYAEAYFNLSHFTEFEEEQSSALEQLYQSANISTADLCFISFALARACEGVGDYERAFCCFARGNTLRRSLLAYKLADDEFVFEQLKQTSPRLTSVPLEVRSRDTNFLPIFIVGLPRSGTTLVEQIISGHEQVTGAGEVPFLSKYGDAIARGLLEPTEESVAEFRIRYLSDMQNLAEGKSVIIDKVPLNFRYIGLIAKAFPEGKIIHVHRDPAAVCWANYKQYFRSNGLGFTNSLEDIVQYYRLYKDLMDFWRKSLPNQIYDLNYEALVKDQEVEIRKLIAYLGIGWDTNCLTPHLNNRRVKTASAAQVRNKIYGGSSLSWRNYERYLGDAFAPLFEG